MRPTLLLLAVLLLAGLTARNRGRAAELPPLKILFLGDNAGHQPAARFAQLRPVFADRNIQLTYTDKTDDLNPATLNRYDGLMVYANQTKITPEQEKALLDYVASGKGFIPVHCASYCFLNSPAYIDLVGAQFRSHTTGTFKATPVQPDHPVLKGYRSFTSWDETYVHHKHNEKDRTVLEVREEGGLKEPWTWVRTHGKGRVFYTAWGHDQRTWGNPGFHNLLERGTRWACGQDPALAGTLAGRPDMTTVPKGLAPFEYVPAKVPFYPESKQWGKQAEPLGRMQKPLPAAESVKHYVTPVGFEVRPFVTEEKLGGKPLAMAWDEKGRLWVSISLDYPNELKRDGQGRDRIVICTDADGDGVCDTVTTFADKLSIVTSLLPYAGGVIAHQAPVTLFLKDTDGDGVADVRQELLRGWSTGDTHAGPSNLRYGFDNWVYGSVGYAGFNGTVSGERMTFRQGYYRFKVEADGAALRVAKLEFLRSTNNNTWGLNFDEAGELFGSTANGCPIVHMPIPNRYTERVRGLSAGPLANIAADNHFEPVTDKVRQVDWHGGFTAASHVALYTARTYPREYWNRTAFVSDPTGHLTATFSLHPNGATFAATYGWNLVASDDEWASPIDAQVGPDGNMWVNDWYNFIVQHNPTPAGFKTGAGAAYETELRDKKHGRIYRVVYAGKADPRPDLANATPEKLVETLKHPNLSWRLHAQRLLVERGQRDVEPALLRLVKDTAADETGLNAGAVHAVWTLSGLLGAKAAPEGTREVVAAGIVHPSAAVRRATYLGLVSKWADQGDALIPQLTNRSPFVDPEASVRVAALLATADLTDAPLLTRVLASHLTEPTFLAPAGLTEATASAGAAHPLRFLTAVAATPKERTLPPAATKVVELVARTFAADPKQPRKGERGQPPATPEGKAPADPASVETLLRSLGSNPAADDAILAGLAAGWPTGRTLALSADGEKAVGNLLARLAPAPRGKLLRLASTWGVKGLDTQLAGVVNGLLATVADVKAADAARVEAAKSVVEFRPDDAEAAAKLLAAVTAETPPAVAAGIFEALGASQSKAVGPAVVGRLRELPTTVRPSAVRMVLARPESAAAFLDAVEKGSLRFDLLALDQKTALASNPDKAIAARAQKLLALGGGLPSPDRQKVIDELHHVVTKTGDVTKGKAVFTAQCAKCHQYAGEGTTVGPDLTGMAVHPKEELLIHILDPSRSVEGNYKAYRVVTVDGRTLVGLLAGETKTAVEVVDGEGKRHPLTRDAIETLAETDKSLMPEGFEKQINPTELTDLLEFLTQKGKYVPVPLDRVATVVTTKGMFFDESGEVERLVFPDWKPKTFKGVPFVLVDPQGDKTKNAVMLFGPNGVKAPTMPKSVPLAYTGKAKAVHLLSGVGGWSYPSTAKGSVSLTVRLRYEDGTTEDHALVNGVHFADYIRRVDVPGSQFAFALRGQQIRYLAVTPRRPDAVLRGIEFVKGPDASAPVIMAVTVESP
jgi:hypothetical protein